MKQLGVDVVIPNMDYLFENKDIAECFLDPWSRGPWGLALSEAEAKVPVFGTELTIELAKLFVKSDSVKKFQRLSMSSIRNSEVILVIPSSLSFKQPSIPEKYQGCDWHSENSYRLHRRL